MHVQVLTGDKQETAINIGYSCNLINEDMRMWVISTSFPDLEHLEAGGQEAEAAQMASERVGEQLAQVRQGGGARGWCRQGCLGQISSPCIDTSPCTHPAYTLTLHTTAHHPCTLQ